MSKYITFSGTVAGALALFCTSAGPVLSASKSKARPVSSSPVSRAKEVPRPRPYEAVISKLAVKNNVPVDLVHAVVRTESNYNVRARGSVGEIGLMQIRLSTARSLGYSGSAKGLYDPKINLEYGTRYLGIAHQLSAGNTCGTILKYNAGHGAKRLNLISARYCQKVKAYLAAIK